MLAGLLLAGAGTVPAHAVESDSTAADVPAPAAEPALPDHIVNGDFEYPTGLRNGNWTLIRPDNATKYDFGKVGFWGAWEPIPGFDAAKFAWRSTQTETADHFGGAAGKGAIEIQRYGTSIAQIVESQKNTAIYQDIDTMSATPVVYHVRLKHAPMATGDWKTDKMQVLIGPPGHETPVRMTRVKSNGYGDKVGETSDVIATTGNLGGMDFDTYEGVVTIPANQPVTRFSFKSISSHDPTTGNQVDDISFEKSYPLAYDGNGGSGNLPEQHE